MVALIFEQGLDLTQEQISKRTSLQQSQVKAQLLKSQHVSNCAMLLTTPPVVVSCLRPLCYPDCMLMRADANIVNDHTRIRTKAGLMTDLDPT